jgi:hypothetical protein
MQAQLDRMIEPGVRMVERVGRQDVADEAAKLRPDPTLFKLYEKTSRAVRLSMALHNRLSQDAAKRKSRGDVGATLERLEREGKRKAKVRQVVEAAIAVYPTGRDKDPLYENLYERLDRPDWIVGDRPLGDVVEALCRDLDVELDDSLWEEANTLLQDMPEQPPNTTLVKDAGPDLTRAVVERALEGNVAALRLCMERLKPPPTRDRTITLPHRKPTSTGEMADVMGDVVGAMASGSITPGQAQNAASVIDTYRRVLELTELEGRMTELEARLTPR